MISRPPFNFQRICAYLLAVSCFLVMGLAVYFDDPVGNSAAFFELSPLGQKGLQVWRSQNCHVCHQLYGFGGYLGPDLTHAAARIDPCNFPEIVRFGSGPMPRMNLDDESVESLFAFLSEMDQSGQGHPAVHPQPEPWEATLGALAKLEPNVAPGVALFQSQGCGMCHFNSRVGRVASPELTESFGRYDRTYLADSMRIGRGSMPAYPDLRPEEIEQLVDMIVALRIHRDNLPKPQFARSEFTWFNYDRPPKETP